MVKISDELYNKIVEEFRFRSTTYPTASKRMYATSIAVRSRDILNLMNDEIIKDLHK
jgi:hypothetical protein